MDIWNIRKIYYCLILIFTFLYATRKYEMHTSSIGEPLTHIFFKLKNNLAWLYCICHVCHMYFLAEFKFYGSLVYFNSHGKKSCSLLKGQAKVKKKKKTSKNKTIFCQCLWTGDTQLCQISHTRRRYVYPHTLQKS